MGSTPAEFSRRILLAVTGLSPQVVAFYSWMVRRCKGGGQFVRWSDPDDSQTDGNEIFKRLR